MDREELLSLAERCEQALGADRVLDELIAAEINDAVREVQPYGRVAYYHKSGSPWLWITVPDPGYTESVDAAMALVPEGWRIWTGDFSIQGRFVWMLCGPQTTWIEQEDGSREGGDDWYQSGVAATPALALTAAALRACASAEPLRVDTIPEVS